MSVDSTPVVTPTDEHKHSPPTERLFLGAVIVYALVAGACAWWLALAIQARAFATTPVGQHSAVSSPSPSPPKQIAPQQ